MSTNYYWIYEQPEPVEILLPTNEIIKSHEVEFGYSPFHIGKRYGCGNGQTAFILAIEPALLFKTLTAYINHGNHTKIVEDEYGRQFSAKTFMILLRDNARLEFHSIGESFC